MADSPLLNKSKAFALEIIRVCNEIKRTQKESILPNQLVRSGTSIGANVSEAEMAQSKADFYSKMSIALKEANETHYWLRLLYAGEYLNKAEYDSISKDVHELIRLLIAICKAAQQAK